MRIVLSAHTWLIAVIFVPYMAMMVTLFAYMWGQVRRHLSAQDDPPDSSDGDEPDVLLAA